MFTKKDYEALEDRIGKITTQPVEEIQVETELPPPLSDMKDSNKAYVQHVAILFIDIRRSTTYHSSHVNANPLIRKISPDLHGFFSRFGLILF